MTGLSAHLVHLRGNSTKSRGTEVPEKYGYFTLENMPCRAAELVEGGVHLVPGQQGRRPAGGFGMFR